MGPKVSAVRGCSFELVNERGRRLIFAVDELRMDVSDGHPARIDGPQPSLEKAHLLMQEGLKLAHAHALTPPRARGVRASRAWRFAFPANEELVRFLVALFEPTSTEDTAKAR